MAGEDSKTLLCSICYLSYKCRVLKCGHALCLDCVENIHTTNNRKIPCPWDGIEDKRDPYALPTPDQFYGRIINTNMEDDVEPEFQRLLAELVKHRTTTIKHLRNVAEILDGHEFNCAISKVAGTVAGVTGSVLAIVGLGLSLSGVGAVVGIPLAITSASVGAAGGATTGLTAVVEAVLQRKGISDVQEVLNKDRFKAQQIYILLQRAADNPDFGEAWNIDPTLLFNAGRVLPGLAKVGVTTAAGARVAMGFGRAAATTGLHVAGLVLAAAVIPLDLAQMVISSIKIHKKKPSQVVKDLKDMADKLEHELRKYLIGEGYFQLIYTIDGKWVYIVIRIQQKLKFDEKLEQGVTVKELQRFGDIVELGEGEMSWDVKRRMQSEWYSHNDDNE